jgi:hypothetical protein
METHIKSTRSVLLREDRGLAHVSNVGARDWADLASKMPWFASKLGSLGDLHLPRSLEGAEIHAQDHISSGQPAAVASGKAGLWTSLVRFRQASARRLALKLFKFPSPNIPHMLGLLSSLPTSFPHGCP